MKYIKIILTSIIITFSSQNILFADTPFFLDFKFILNESDAGKKAQTYLKNKLEKGIKSIQDKEKKILEEEKKLIQQKKVLAQEEYVKKVKELRTKVSSLQKERNNLMQSVAKQRSKAKNELLKALNPIVKEYMMEKKIRMIMNKKDILLADEKLNITSDIMKLINNKLKSIKLN